MKEDLIPQLLIIKWFAQSFIEEADKLNAWLEIPANQKYKTIVQDIQNQLRHPGFLNTLKPLPDQTALNTFLDTNTAVKDQLIGLLRIKEKKTASQNPSTALPLDLTTVAQAWYQTNPPAVSRDEITAIQTFLTTQASQNVCFFGINLLGAVSKDLAKFILDDQTVFTKVAADTVPFGAEPILALGLQAGYCEYQYNEHRFFIERFLQFAGDASVPRPANLTSACAPAHAVQTLLFRTGYYKTIQVAIASANINPLIFCEEAIRSGLLDKIIKQVSTPEKYPNGYDIDKSQEAKSILAWDGLPWIGDEKIKQLACVAKYCVSTKLTVCDFLKVNALPNSIRVLFISNSSDSSLTGFADWLANQFTFPQEQKAELIWAYLKKTELWHSISTDTQKKLSQFFSSNIPYKPLDPATAKILYGESATMMTPAPNVDTSLVEAFRELFVKANTLTRIQEVICGREALDDLLTTLYKENNLEDVAIVLHLLALQTSSSRYQIDAVKTRFTNLVKLEQPTPSGAASLAASMTFFSSLTSAAIANENITVRFYAYIHNPISSQSPENTLKKLFESNVERYAKLITATSSCSKEFLPAEWFINLPQLLNKASDKPKVIQQLIDFYQKSQSDQDEHLTWLKALLHFYKQETTNAAALFKQLESQSTTYKAKASEFLKNCQPTEVRSVPIDQQKQMHERKDNIFSL